MVEWGVGGGGEGGGGGQTVVGVGCGLQTVVGRGVGGRPWWGGLWIVDRGEVGCGD